MHQKEDDCSYEEVEEVYEVDEEGNEWLVTEEYEEVDEDHDSPEAPTVVIANLGALDTNARNSSNTFPSTTSRFLNHQKEPIRGDTSTVFGDTSTVQVSNITTSRQNQGMQRASPQETESAKEATSSPNGSSRLSLGNRFKSLIVRSPEEGKEQPSQPETQHQGDPATTEPVASKAENPALPKKTRQIRRIRKPRGVMAEEGALVDTTTETIEEDPNEPIAVYTISIVKDETTGREISRSVTGKKPPHYQPQGPNEKRYMTKTYRKTRTNPVNRHKEVEETTITYEKPRSPIFEQTLPASALKPTNDLNPARKTTQWEQPVWVKNKLEAGSSIRTGANLEKPITAATTNRKKAGALSFTIERA